MLDRFNDFVAENNLWSEGDRLLLAVSGGLDSVVLGSLLHRSGADFELVHVNYHLRGKDSDKDEAFVRKLAKEWKVPIHVKDADLSNHKGSIQDKARKVRYRFFEDCLEKQELNFLITAHHQDDRVETMLLNLFRGTGIYGLKGVPTKDGRRRRPLIWARKHELMAFAKKEGIAYREDASNAKADYFRNLLRLKVLPKLRSFDAAIDDKLLTSSHHLEQDAHLLLDLVQERLIPIGDATHLLIKGMNPSSASSLIYHAFRSEGLNRSQAFDLANALPSSKVQLKECTLKRSRDHVSLLPNSEPVMLELQIKDDGRVHWQYGNLEVFNGNDQPVENDPENRKVSLSLHAKDFPLTLRSLQHGDRFQPLGSSYEVVARKYLLEKGASYADLRGVVVLCNAENKICWIPGWQVSEHFKRENDEGSIVSLYFDQNGD